MFFDLSGLTSVNLFLPEFKDFGFYVNLTRAWNALGLFMSFWFMFCDLFYLRV